jgi:hypothetical protein
MTQSESHAKKAKRKTVEERKTFYKTQKASSAACKVKKNTNERNEKVKGSITSNSTLQATHPTTSPAPTPPQFWSKSCR